MYKCIPTLIICDYLCMKFPKRGVPHLGYYLLHYKRRRLYIYSRSLPFLVLMVLPAGLLRTAEHPVETAVYPFDALDFNK